MTMAGAPIARARLLVEIDTAARVLAPLWPIGTFIAINPLWDLRNLGFHRAIAHQKRFLALAGYPSIALLADAYQRGRICNEDLDSALAEEKRGGDSEIAQREEAPVHTIALRDRSTERVLNREIARWCAKVLAARERSQGDLGLYALWQRNVITDRGMRALVGRAGCRNLALLPADPVASILLCLGHLGFDDDSPASTEVRVDVLTQQLAALPGWGGLAKWRARWATSHDPRSAPTLIDLLAIRLAILNELSARGSASVSTNEAIQSSSDPGDVAQAASLTKLLPPALAAAMRERSPREIHALWLRAYENHLRDELLEELNRPTVHRVVAAPTAQLLCCIDSRSEGLRRHFERLGPYATLGVAGFFGLPMRFHALGAAPIDLSPALVRPTLELSERVDIAGESAFERTTAGRAFERGLHHASDQVRESALSSFLSAEAGGLLVAPLLILRTIAPRLVTRIKRAIHSRLVPPLPTRVELTDQETAGDIATQVLSLETVLRASGLTENFAPLVVLCGHGSTSQNNPYAAALDCGACGGNRGGTSARTAATLHNREEIRIQLAERGIGIPRTTWFVAAEHDTALDRVTLFDGHLVPSSHRERTDRVIADLSWAGAALARERYASLPGANYANRMQRDPSPNSVAREVERRSSDWAELQPEWGLARNAFLLIAPRSLSVGHDLARRAFLHSYDPDRDPEGTALETILTAPMVVAHWINAQYYFSTVDPTIYSAGDKTVHNIVAGTAVVEGAIGDLKLGLPRQSLFLGDSAVHEPVRLLVVIEAPLDRIDGVIERNPLLRELFDGEWLHLAAHADRNAPWSRRRPGGGWILWSPTERCNRDEEVRYG